MKSKIILILTVLLMAFVLVLIWPALSGGSAGYQPVSVEHSAAN